LGGRRVKNRVNQATEGDLVQRNFAVDRPNVLWLSDIVERPGDAPKERSPRS
jgi:transposase InsO family protein